MFSVYPTSFERANTPSSATRRMETQKNPIKGKVHRKEPTEIGSELRLKVGQKQLPEPPKLLNNYARQLVAE